MTSQYKIDLDIDQTISFMIDYIRLIIDFVTKAAEHLIPLGISCIGSVI